MPVPYIGCTGWSHPEWAGGFYPRRLAPTGRLSAYAKSFPAVELDATLDGIPSPATVASWIQRVEGVARFRFCPLAPRSLGASLARGSTTESLGLARDWADVVLGPLADAERLGPALVELPPDLAVFAAPQGHDIPGHLMETLDAIDPRRFAVAVELTHGSWYEHVGERVLPEVLEPLSARGVAVVRVDGFGRPMHASRGAPWTYFRFQGRREHVPPSERGFTLSSVSYEYNGGEIEQLARAVRNVMAEDTQTYAIFRNTPRGHAPRNAAQLQAALGLRDARAGPARGRTVSLDEFGADDAP